MEVESKPRIEPYPQSMGKLLTDMLFDLGCLSESLSRDGLEQVEDMAALMFQQVADITSRGAGLVKKYKKLGDDVRHVEEMEWIARAKCAEEKVLQLQDEIEVLVYGQGGKVWDWAQEAGRFLQRIVTASFVSGKTGLRALEAQKLVGRAVTLGIAVGAPESEFAEEERETVEQGGEADEGRNK